MLIAVLTGLAVLGPGCSGGDDTLPTAIFSAPDTAVSYKVQLSGLPDAEMVSIAEKSLALYRLRDRGAMSLAFLKRRAGGGAELPRPRIETG